MNFDEVQSMLSRLREVPNLEGIEGALVSRVAEAEKNIIKLNAMVLAAVSLMDADQIAAFPEAYEKQRNN